MIEPQYKIDEDELYRTNIQSIRDQLNAKVCEAARQFVRPSVSHEFRDDAYHIVIRETAVRA